MVYFIIIPLFIFLEVLLLAASLVVLKFPKVHWTNGYLVGVMLGSTAGFAAANLMLWVVFLLFAVVLKYPLPGFVQSLLKFILAFCVFLGPFIFSAAGLMLGSLSGIYIVYRRRKTAK